MDAARDRMDGLKPKPRQRWVNFLPSQGLYLKTRNLTRNVKPLEVQALHQTAYFNKLYQAQQDQLSAAQEDLQAHYARHTELTETWTVSQAYLQKIKSGDWGAPQAHIHHKHLPEPPVGKQARLAELWAAISGGLLLFAFAVLLILAPSRRLILTILVGAIFATIEATLR